MFPLCTLSGTVSGTLTRSLFVLHAVPPRHGQRQVVGGGDGGGERGLLRTEQAPREAGLRPQTGLRPLHQHTYWGRVRHQYLLCFVQNVENLSWRLRKSRLLVWHASPWLSMRVSHNFLEENMYTSEWGALSDWRLHFVDFNWLLNLSA